MSSPSPLPRPRSGRSRLWIFLGGFALGMVVLVGLLLAPPVQGWLLRRVVARQPGWRVDFKQIGVGPAGLDASGLEFAMPGVAASSEPVAIRVAFAQLFSKRELRLERVEAQKIRLTLTPAELAPSPPFAGLLRLLQSPVPWALDTAHLDGDLVLREGSESRVTGNFKIRGGGVTASSPGEFAYELAANSMILPPGPDHKFTSAGTIRLTQTPAHGIAHIAIDGNLQLPRYGALSLPAGHVALDVTATPTGESYTAHLSFGPEVGLDLDLEAALNAASTVLTGRATLRANPAAAALVSGDRMPRTTVDGGLSFAFDLRTGDLDATITGDLDARDWQKLMPQLAALDALKGQLTSTITRRGEQLRLKTLSATLRGEMSAAEARISVTQPVDLRNLPRTPVGEVVLAHWPIGWANPFLTSAGVQLAPGEFSAGWTLALDGSGGMRLVATGPATIGPIVLSGEKLPPLPAMAVSFRPGLEASLAKLAFTLDDFTVTSVQGDRLDGQLALSREAATGELHTIGSLKASLPTWFSGPTAKQPFLFNAAWDAALAGTRLHFAALELFCCDNPNTQPSLALELRRPVDFALEKPALSFPTNSPSPEPATSPPTTTKGDTPDAVRLRFANFPLAWLSRWLPGKTVTGRLVEGESALRPVPEAGGFALHTSVPWRLDGVSLGTKGVTPVTQIEARLSPSFTLRGDHLEMEFDEIAARDGNANRLSGRVGGTASFAEKSLTAELALDAELPSLPHSEGTFGPLRASLRGKFHNLTPRIMGADTFEARVWNAADELLAVDAPQPFLFGLSNSNMVVVSTVAPLRLKLAGFPLAWLRPWSGAFELEGRLEPVELRLSSAVNQFTVKAAEPLTLNKFSTRKAGRELIRDATVSLEPLVDFTLISVTQPKFETVYTGTAQAKNATVEFGGRRAVDLEVSLGFKGNETTVLPDVIDLHSRVDFAALPTGAALGLPARGTLVTRVAGDLLGLEPVELHARLEGLPTTVTKESLPPLEVTLRGKLTRENLLAGHVELLLAATPQPTDAAFDVNLNLVEGGLDITSDFRSRFIDGEALLALSHTFSSGPRASVSAAPPKKKIAVAAKPGSASDASLPFWGELRGSFNLDIGALQFAPYRIERIRGRLNADQRTLRLLELSGEMFVGRWGGGLSIDHDPANTTGEHTLQGQFHIEQFESARVVQTVFPNQLASVDARINLHAQVTSHGNSFVALIDQSAADFTVDGQNGVVRLTVPRADAMSTAAVFGGTLLLSPELRALGRLLKKFAEMPLDRLYITGHRAVSGEVTLDEFLFASPQANLLGHGRIPTGENQPLMNRPLELSLELAAKDELAVILGGMRLLEKKPRPDGFRVMLQPFTLGGRAGAPDTAPLYDLLAKAVSGSHGTWGFLMRKMQSEIAKKKTPPIKPAP